MAQLDPQLAVLFALTSGVGYLMVLSGVGKGLMDWKRRRACPSCGRTPCSCVYYFRVAPFFRSVSPIFLAAALSSVACSSSSASVLRIRIVSR